MFLFISSSKIGYTWRTALFGKRQKLINEVSPNSIKQFLNNIHALVCKLLLFLCVQIIVNQETICLYMSYTREQNVKDVYNNYITNKQINMYHVKKTKQMSTTSLYY